MAFSSGTIYEVRSSGNDLNSGGFNAAGAGAGTDYTQQDGPQITIDGATITATVHTTTTQLTLVGHTVTNADRRNTIRIVAGGTSAVTGFYEITAVDTVNNRWTMSSSMGTAGQTVVGRVGGGWASLTHCANTGGSLGASPTVWLKNTGTLSINGLSAMTTGATFRGYGTTRGDSGRTTISISANRTAVWFLQSTLSNLILDLAGFNQTSGQVLNQSNNVRNLDIINGGSGSSSTMIVVWGIYSMLANCYVEVTSGNTATGINNDVNGKVFNTVVRGAATAFTGGTNGRGGFNTCIAISAATRGFTFSGSFGEGLARNCAAIDCGIGFYSGGSPVFENCLATGCTTYSYDVSTGTGAQMFRCASYDPGTANINGTPSINENFVSLTNDPFNDAGTEDFSYNDVAGGGAELKDILINYPDLANTPVYATIGPFYPQLGSGSGNVGLVGGILGS